MIPRETVAKILDAAQITEVVGDFVSLKRRGSGYVACCPFHNEKTPSFHVSPAKGIYKCFGCGKSGTAVGFVMEHESLDYPEALRYLAKKYSIEIQEREETPEEIQARQRSESLYIVSEFAGKFFAQSLDTDEGRTIGYAYFKNRGLEDATIKKYGLGWSPKSRHALADAALSKGYKAEYLVDTGLCYSRDDGSLTDKFFDRVMFPIHSVSGRVVAFGGRTLRSDHEIAKYVNSPETEIYHKSDTLYGIYFAKNAISRMDKCYLVEGYLDVLSMHQLGIVNVVASSGTSLTVPQIRLIRKFTQNVTIMYDGDKAGIKAALRGIGLILKEGLNVKVVLLPDGDDPDSYSRKHTLEEVQAFIASAECDFITFKTDLLLDEAGRDPLKRAELINDIADTIALIPDMVKRTVYAQTCADKFDIDVGILTSRIASSRRKMIEAEHIAKVREEERAERRINAGLPEQMPEEVQAERPAKQVSVAGGYENAFLAPLEKDLLWFIFNYGIRELEFETDSPYYDSEYKSTVADFIRQAFEDDSHEMENSLFRKAWNAYFEKYDTEDCQDIVKSIMDGQDREVAALAARLTQEKYPLSVKNFEHSMTSISTMLVKSLPRTILVYQSRRLQQQIKIYTDRIRNTSDVSGQMDLLKEIQTLSEIRKKVEDALVNKN